jgi:hypothetical protein
MLVRTASGKRRALGYSYGMLFRELVASTPSTMPTAEGRDPSAKTLHSRDGVVVLEVGRVCVAIWRGAVTNVSFGWQRDGLAQVVRNHPEGAAFLCVIEPTAKPPDDALRKASNRMIADHGDALKCVAVVIEGEGFRAAITRGVISGMALLHPRRTPGASFSNIGEALGWIHLRVPLQSILTFSKKIEEGRALLGEAVFS